MADKRDRDEKGRFIKGNSQRYIKGESKPVEHGKKGAPAAAEVRRRRKLLRETLIEELTKETAVGSGLTKQEAIVAAVVKNMYDKPSAKALKIITEILGELEVNINLNQTDNRPTIRFSDE